MDQPIRQHRQADYASLSGDGVILDVHLCEVCHQEWPCDASVLQEELQEVQKSVHAEHDRWSITSVYMESVIPEHARPYMRCDHPLCVAGKQHDRHFGPDRV